MNMTGGEEKPASDADAPMEPLHLVVRVPADAVTMEGPVAWVDLGHYKGFLRAVLMSYSAFEEGKAVVADLYGTGEEDDVKEEERAGDHTTVAENGSNMFQRR